LRLNARGENVPKNTSFDAPDLAMLEPGTPDVISWLAQLG